MERLIKEGVLPNLDFLYFGIYINYIKGKLTNKFRKGKRARKESILELIQTDMCGSISPSAMGDFKYFITFINNHLRFGWMELLIEKI